MDVSIWFAQQSLEERTARPPCTLLLQIRQGREHQAQTCVDGVSFEQNNRPGGRLS